MRFSDFFISYKIGLKGIKSTIPFTKLPLYRKIAVVATYSMTISGCIMFMFKLFSAGIIILLAGIISLIIFLIIDSRKKNLELMLKEHYTPYSKKRMNMVINVLHEYKFDILNSSLIDLLIEEAQKAQIQSDYLALLKKPLRTIGAIIIPIVAYAAPKIADTVTPNEMIVIAVKIIIIILMIFSIIFALTTIIKDIFYHDYNAYNELIYDLRQIKLFYSEGRYNFLKL